MAMLTSTAWFTSITMGSVEDFLNPDISAETTYLPTLRLGKEYLPASLVVVFSAVPRSTSVATILTPETTAPLLSRTVPLMREATWLNRMQEAARRVVMRKSIGAAGDMITSLRCYFR